jgi:hypothetical protein
MPDRCRAIWPLNPIPSVANSWCNRFLLGVVPALVKAMRRRDFIKGIAGSATIWPLAARAQQPGKLPTIGFLGTDPSIWGPYTAAFVQRLRELAGSRVARSQ